MTQGQGGKNPRTGGARETIRVGHACERCGRGDWEVWTGHNRCRCGQRLWIERAIDEEHGVHFRYRQGPTLPAGYRGWITVTQ
jgi:hypothetical protein